MAERAESAVSDPSPQLRRLLPPGVPVLVGRVVEELRLAELARRMSPIATRNGRRRPYLVLNMVSTADGRATVEGRSGPIGNLADRALFHGLRTAVDAVMAGAGTIRVERYRRPVREQPARQARRERGLAEEPWACVVSGRLDLPPDIPLLGDPAARVVILTSSAASLPQTPGGGQVEYVRCARDGLLDLSGGMAELYERFGIATVLCEGGPHTNSQLLAEGLVDELFLSLAPKLAGGDVTDEALRILAGPAIDPPLELELVSAFEHESHLFLRYRLASS
jgi:5-amino-6-(5-phosphoribosylamino)uracil reductase